MWVFLEATVMFGSYPCRGWFITHLSEILSHWLQMKRLIPVVRGQKAGDEVQALHKVFENSVCSPPCPMNNLGGEPWSWYEDMWVNALEHFLFQTSLSPGHLQKKTAICWRWVLKNVKSLTHLEHTLSWCTSFLLYLKYRNKKMPHPKHLWAISISESVSKLYESLLLFLWQNIGQKQLKRGLFRFVAQREHSSMEKKALVPSRRGSL